MKTRSIVCRYIWCVCVVSLLFAYAIPAYAGTGEDDNHLGTTPVTLGSIVPLVTETGKISLSVDGLGTNAPVGIVQVQKPTGATVRGAYIAAASTGFSDYVLADGDVTIDNASVVWNVIPTTPSSIHSNNSFANVTALVKPKLDAAPAGRVDFVVGELEPFQIDGTILAVIFDDPNQATSNTIVLLFGAQAVTGDTFAIGLAEPLNLSDPHLALDLSLGISFGFQNPPGNINQVSLVDVNGKRMTSSAGGQDDSDIFPGADGSLLTVGGLDDSNDNPADPLGRYNSGQRTQEKREKES